MGIYNKIRGGVDSNHRTGRMDYPYAGDGSPSPQMYMSGGTPPKNEPIPKNAQYPSASFADRPYNN